jgi:hypothetical protein
MEQRLFHNTQGLAVVRGQGVKSCPMTRPLRPGASHTKQNTQIRSRTNNTQVPNIGAAACKQSKALKSAPGQGSQGSQSLAAPHSCATPVDAVSGDDGLKCGLQVARGNRGSVHDDLHTVQQPGQAKREVGVGRQRGPETGRKRASSVCVVCT